MAKYFSALLTLLLCFSFLGCNQSKSQNTTNNSSSKAVTDTNTKDNTSELISKNAPQTPVILTNPKTMQLDTKPRPTAQITADKKLIEDGAEYIMKYAIENGIDKTMEEIGKGRDGDFKEYIPEAQTYLSLVNEEEEGVWIIRAHIINDYAGMAVPVDQMVDFSGWNFLIEANKSQETTNRIWIDNTYMKDPNWADGNVCKQASYYRWFDMDGEKYSVYYGLWMDE